LSYSGNKKQQRFINTKSRFILGIFCPELTRHWSRVKLGITAKPKTAA